MNDETVALLLLGAVRGVQALLFVVALVAQDARPLLGAAGLLLADCYLCAVLRDLEAQS